jgi:hypothetical protein
MANRNELIKEKVLASKNQLEFNKDKEAQLSQLNASLQDLENKVGLLHLSKGQVFP